MPHKLSILFQAVPNEKPVIAKERAEHLTHLTEGSSQISAN